MSGFHPSLDAQAIALPRVAQAAQNLEIVQEVGAERANRLYMINFNAQKLIRRAKIGLVFVVCYLRLRRAR